MTFRLGAGTYIVREVMPSCAWVATTPQQQTITVPPGGPQQVWFGNVCLGAGGGHSPGFWSNKNGEYTINAMIRSGIDVYARLRALDLKDGRGCNFDPCNYTQLRTWLRAGNAAYMPYQLSVQLAAMELNVWSGFVKGGAAGLRRTRHRLPQHQRPDGPGQHGSWTGQREPRLPGAAEVRPGRVRTTTAPSSSPAPAASGTSRYDRVGWMRGWRRRGRAVKPAPAILCILFIGQSSVLHHSHGSGIVPRR